jgi:hypothetical protein
MEQTLKHKKGSGSFDMNRFYIITNTKKDPDYRFTNMLKGFLLLNGKKAQAGDDYTLSISNGVATIQMNVPTAKVLSLQCSDSDYIMSDLIPENSAEGRKQLNNYTRGTYDDPRLVLQQVWAGDFLPILKYYSIKDKGSKDVSFDIEYLPYPIMEDGAIEIPQRVEYAVLNTIVAHVLDSYREFEIADRFRAKAKDSLAE